MQPLRYEQRHIMSRVYDTFEFHIIQLPYVELSRLKMTDLEWDSILQNSPSSAVSYRHNVLPNPTKAKLSPLFKYLIKVKFLFYIAGSH